MRSRPQISSRAVLAGIALGGSLFAFAACGGNKATDGAKLPEPPSSSSAAVVPSTPDLGPTTTTTAALADAGDAQGTKLAPVSSAPSDAGAQATATSDGGRALESEPGRTRADIQAIVGVTHRDEARACYCRTAKNDPTLKGNLLVLWTIDPKGNVTTTSVDPAQTQIADPAIQTCIQDVIKKIKFAESPGRHETRAQYLYNFAKKCDPREGQ